MGKCKNLISHLHEGIQLIHISFFSSTFERTMVTHDQLKDISTRVSKLKGYLEIDKKLIEITNEEERTANPDFWNNPKEAEVLMKSLRFKKKMGGRLQYCCYP